MKLLYNAVGKAGSSTVGYVLSVLSFANNFTIYPRPGSPNLTEEMRKFYPSPSTFVQLLNLMPDHSVYWCHANFMRGAGADTTWFNVIREPIDRFQSLHYYAVDPISRGRIRAAHVLENAEKDTKCGCARPDHAEFDACVRHRYAMNCSLEVPSQISQFCGKHSNCSLEVALENVHKAYTLVGLTEEMELTFSALQKLLPDFFRGSIAALHSSKSQRVTSMINPLTNTSMAGSVSSLAKDFIARRATNYRDEVTFYREVKHLFWRKVVELGLVLRS